MNRTSFLKMSTVASKVGEMWEKTEQSVLEMHALTVEKLNGKLLECSDC